MENEHLHLLINEEIYAIESQASSDQLQVDSEESIVDNQQSTEDPVIEKINTNSQTQSTEKINIAFIHQTNNPDELDLLNKIIGACKLETQNFKVLKEGEPIQFEKAVIFTDSASSYCIPSTTTEGEIMYSKPLNILYHSPEEKRKLWGALQEFVKA